MIRLHSVDKSYGALKVLHGIEAEILEGETFAIIGPNGAGKTTLFKVMTGEVGCEAGTVEFLGKDVTKEPAYRRTRAGMGRTFQMARIFKEMTAEENIVVAIEARAKNMGQRDTPWYQVRPSRATVDEAGEILARLSLERKARIAAAQLSHGDKKRLELAMSLVLRPKILLLDEPTAGMSPADRKASVDLIASVKARHGMTVVLTEHDMGVVFDLASHVAVLHHGEMIATGSPAQVRENPLVRKIYLGSGAGHA